MVCPYPVAPMAKEEKDSREKDWIQAKSLQVLYPLNSYRSPTKQPLKISSKLAHPLKS